MAKRISSLDLERVQTLFDHFPNGLPMRRHYKKVTVEWLERGANDGGEKKFDLGISTNTFHAVFRQSLKEYGHFVDEYGEEKKRFYGEDATLMWDINPHTNQPVGEETPELSMADLGDRFLAGLTIDEMGKELFEKLSEKMEGQEVKAFFASNEKVLSRPSARVFFLWHVWSVLQDKKAVTLSSFWKDPSFLEALGMCDEDVVQVTCLFKEMDELGEIVFQLGDDETESTIGINAKGYWLLVDFLQSLDGVESAVSEAPALDVAEEPVEEADVVPEAEEETFSEVIVTEPAEQEELQEAELAEEEIDVPSDLEADSDEPAQEPVTEVPLEDDEEEAVSDSESDGHEESQKEETPKSTEVVAVEDPLDSKIADLQQQIAGKDSAIATLAAKLRLAQEERETLQGRLGELLRQQKERKVNAVLDVLNQQGLTLADLYEHSSANK